MGQRRGAPDTSHSLYESIILSVREPDEKTKNNINKFIDEKEANKVRWGLEMFNIPASNYIPFAALLTERYDIKLDTYPSEDDLFAPFTEDTTFDALERTFVERTKFVWESIAPEVWQRKEEIASKIVEKEIALYTTEILKTLENQRVTQKTHPEICEAVIKLIETIGNNGDVVAVTQVLHDVVQQADDIPNNFLGQLAGSIINTTPQGSKDHQTPDSINDIASAIQHHVNQELKNQYREAIFEKKLEYERIDHNLTPFATFRGLRQIGNDKAGKKVVQTILTEGFNQGDEDLLRSNIQTGIKPETGWSIKKGHTDKGISLTSDLKIAMYFAGGGDDGGWVFLTKQDKGVLTTKYKPDSNPENYSNSEAEEAEVFCANVKPEEIIGAVYVTPVQGDDIVSTEHRGGENFNFFVDDAMVNQRFDQVDFTMEENGFILCEIMQGIASGEIEDAELGFHHKKGNEETAGQEFDVTINYSDGTSQAVENLPSFSPKARAALVTRNITEQAQAADLYQYLIPAKALLKVKYTDALSPLKPLFDELDERNKDMFLPVSEEQYLCAKDNGIKTEKVKKNLAAAKDVPSVHDIYKEVRLKDFTAPPSVEEKKKQLENEKGAMHPYIETASIKIVPPDKEKAAKWKDRVEQMEKDKNKGKPR